MLHFVTITDFGTRITWNGIGILGVKIARLMVYTQIEGGCKLIKKTNHTNITVELLQ